MAEINWNTALKGRSLLTLDDLSHSEMIELIDLALTLKARRRSGLRGDLLRRQQVALVFEKLSTRTRAAAVVAARDEGGQAEYLNPQDIHLGVKESVADTARVLGRMFDGILFRGFAQQTVESLAGHAGVPVWNGLTDLAHPTQALADLMTIREVFGRLQDLRVVYIGDGRNNVALSLMLACAKAGLSFVNCTPSALSPDPDRVAWARSVAAATGGDIRIEHDPATGVEGADVLYTDVWVSMGEEAETEARIRLLRPYQVNRACVERTGTPPGRLLFLHCLPAFHDDQTQVTRETGALEVTHDVFESDCSRVFDQAENRMHTMKALFVATMAEGSGR